MALLEWIGQRVSRNRDRGCPSRIDATVEFSDRDAAARKTRARRKAEMFERLEALPRRIGASQPDSPSWRTDAVGPSAGSRCAFARPDNLTRSPD